MTQEEVAAAAGLSVHVLSKIERGLSSTRIETQAALATALRLDWSRIFEPKPLPIGRFELEEQLASVGRVLSDTSLTLLIELAGTVKRMEAPTDRRSKSEATWGKQQPSCNRHDTSDD
jgi:transcriptional regulator with XRE-family HTH domain